MSLGLPPLVTAGASAITPPYLSMDVYVDNNRNYSNL